VFKEVSILCRNDGEYTEADQQDGYQKQPYFPARIVLQFEQSTFL